MISQDKMIFCTLFDSNYLDRGLALYCSMRKHISSFKLYIFAFDDQCYEILCDMCLKNVIVVPLGDIMDDCLWEKQGERTCAEFCWTCTPVVIEYVLVHFREKVCTYVDADTYLFADPEKEIAEIEEQKCSVGLVPHRFERSYLNIYYMFNNGKYCIQFNTFFNDNEGRTVLHDWKNDCLKWCYCRYEEGKYGDQKYPDTWKMKYSGVYETENPGIGVAPWNLHMYSCKRKGDGKIWMSYRGKEFPLILYHFEGMKYLDDGRIFLNLWEPDHPDMKRKVRLIYGEYFKVLGTARKKLRDQYGLSFEHREVSRESFLGDSYSLKKYCRDRGLAGGLKAWMGFQINNLARV